MPNTPTARATLLFLAVLLAALPATAQKRDRAQLLKEIAGLREQLREKEGEFLDATPEDRAAYSDLLAQPDAGIIRLLPRETYDEVYEKQTALTTRGGGSFYSFARLSHEYGHGSDLMLERDEFQCGGFAGACYGMVVSLGDVPVESVTVRHPAVEYLYEHIAPTALPDARAIQYRLYDGVTHGEYNYKERVPAKLGVTYVERSVNYDFSDVLVAFRAVRKDDDGSLIILYRLLNTYEIPKLVRVPEDDTKN